MAKSLIIVESPAKTRTLKAFLGDRFDVRASMGHVRDLPKSKLGVDVEHDFEPSYVTIRERKEVLKDLKSAAEKSDRVYLASDPDREGEAIAWHLAQELKLHAPLRIEFNEITRQAVQSALETPRGLDENRFNAQQARRVLDRLIGYKLSPLLWKKVESRLSAGRVQSVAVRLICDREREVAAFVPVEYWSITAHLTPDEETHAFDAKLIEKAGRKIELHDQESAHTVLRELDGARYVVADVKKRQQKRNPSPPFITSTLQQEAARKLGFSAKRTMLIAQQLYEGLDLGEDGHVGLITYMRTDSTRVAQEAATEAQAYIKKTYGKEYLPEKPRQYKSAKSAQEAHEAIRPTSVLRTPEAVRTHLGTDQARLYTLIWQRFVASQMASGVLDITIVDVRAGDYLFRASGSVIHFPGFIVVYTEGRDDAREEDDRQALPALTAQQMLTLLSLLPRQHFTEPPPRYSEATLVRALEEKGIGRPSTYANIISTIQERYVTLEEKRFKPTDLGFKVTDLLVKYFPDVLDVEFTAGVEDRLDGIEEGDQDWVRVIREFYGPFDEKLAIATEQAERTKAEPVFTEDICPLCGRKMVLRQGRFGPFLGCSGYPQCTKILPAPEQKLNLICPRTECAGEVIQKRSKKGKVFYGCSEYPKCDFVTWHRPLATRCSTCGYPMGEKSWRGRVLGEECTNRECSTVPVKAVAADGPEAEGAPAKRKSPAKAAKAKDGGTAKPGKTPAPKSRRAA